MCLSKTTGIGHDLKRVQWGYYQFLWMLVGSAEHHEGPDGSAWKAPAGEGIFHTGCGGNGESFGRGRETLDGVNERSSFTGHKYCNVTWCCSEICQSENETLDESVTYIFWRILFFNKYEVLYDLNAFCVCLLTSWDININNFPQPVKFRSTC